MNTINLQIGPELFAKHAIPEHDAGKQAADAFRQQLTASAQFGDAFDTLVSPTTVTVQDSGKLTAPIAAPTEVVPTTTAEFIAVQNQSENTAGASKTVHVAELYESKHLAIGRLSYLDRDVVGSATTTSALNGRTAPVQTSSGLSSTQTGALAPGHQSREATQSPLLHGLMDRTEQSTPRAEKDRVQSSIVQLPEMLAPWMRRRVSVSGDENRIQVLVRDYEASRQELEAVVEAVLLHAKAFNDGREIAVTVNGMPLHDATRLIGGQQNAG